MEEGYECAGYLVVRRITEIYALLLSSMEKKRDGGQTGGIGSRSEKIFGASARSRGYSSDLIDGVSRASSAKTSLTRRWIFVSRPDG